MKNKSLLKNFNDLSIIKKLYWIVGIMLAIIIIELGVFLFSMDTLSQIRIFTSADARWARAEKDAIYDLRKYAHTGNKQSYWDYRNHLKMPIASLKARFEFDKPKPDMDTIRAALIESGIHHNDIKLLITFFFRQNHVYSFDKAANFWKEKTNHITSLSNIGEQLHKEINSASPSEKRIQEIINQTDIVEDQLAKNADLLSDSLEEDARNTSDLIKKIIFGITLTVGFTGLLFLISLNRRIIKGLKELDKVVESVTQGNYNTLAKVFSQDEIGIIAIGINRMTEQLEKQISQIKQSEEAARQSEKQFRNLFENTSELIHSTLISDRKFLYVNPAWRKTLEYTEEETKNLYLKNVIDPEFMTNYPQFFEKISRGENIEHLEPVFISKSGKKIYMEGSIVCYVKNGVPISTLGIFRNITDKIKAEERQAILTAIIDYSSDAIISTTLNGTVTSWNKGAEHLFGYTNAEISGRSVFVISPPHRIDEDPPLLEKIKHGNLIEHYETERMKRDGSIIPVSISLSPINDASGKVIGISKIIHDITDRKIAQERVRQIVEFSPNAIALVNKEGKMILVNPKMEKMFGYSQNELLEQKVEMLLPEKFRQKHQELLKEYFDNPKVRMIGEAKEIYGLAKNGNEIPLEIGLNPISTPQGIQALATIVDITERKRSTEELKQTNDFLNAILENIPSVIFVKDAKDLKFIRVNEEVEKLFGYSKDEIIGKNDYELFPKHEADLFVANDKKLLETGKILKIEEEPAHTKFKGIRILETKIVLLNDTNGKPLYLLGISNDITDRKRISEELKLKSEELTRSNTELEQFAYVASHDLQEPLRMITSYLQLLENRYKDKLDKDANEFIAFAVDGSARMKILILSLLEYSRVNRVKPFEEIDVNLLLKDVLANLSNSIKESNAVIKIDDLPKIKGDHLLIGQLFQNLIENGIKFRKDKNPEIIISGKKENNEYLFSVKDNGIGIQKEYMNKIFVIFQRLNSKEKYPGTGIGLAICKKIVEKHGGKIWVESEMEKGSTFYFTIKQN